MEPNCACSHTTEIGVLEPKQEPSLTHALAPAVSLTIMQYRAKDATPDPKCSNEVLVAAAATAKGKCCSICRKGCTASLLQTVLGHHQHGQSTGTGTAV